MAENVEIARGVVRIDTDVSAVAPALSEVKKSVDDVTQSTNAATAATREFADATKTAANEAAAEAERAAADIRKQYDSKYDLDERAAQSTKKVGEAHATALASVSRFRAGLVRVLSVLGLVTAGFELLRRGLRLLSAQFDDGAARAGKFVESIESTEAEARLEAINQKLKELRESQEQVSNSRIRVIGEALTGGLMTGVQDEIEELAKLQTEYAARVAEKNAERAAAATQEEAAEKKRVAEQTAREVEAIEDRIRSLRNSTIEDERVRMVREANEEIYQLRRQADREERYSVAQAMRAEADAIAEVLELRIRAYDKRMAEEARLRQESQVKEEQAARDQLDKTARAASEAFSRVQSDIASKLNNVGIERLAGSIETLIQRLGVLAETNRNGQRRL